MQAKGQATDFKVPDSNLSIRVGPTQSHPFLAEFERSLVLERDGTGLVKDRLYPGTGSGSLANLYQVKKDQYVLVDMNGYWFEIDVKAGQLKAGGWHWEEEAPGGYVGCFTFDAKKERFGFFSPAEMKERSPYMVKDPGRYDPATPPSSASAPMNPFAPAGNSGKK